MNNTLYYGDNLDVLWRYVADESVDLVYLDLPPRPSMYQAAQRVQRPEGRQGRMDEAV